jgi:hypothetical protein
MDKKEIITHLKDNYAAFVQMIEAMSEEDFLFTTDNKWTPGQQADHILRSIKPVNMAFAIPIFVLDLVFGKANRQSRSYAGLVHRYFDKLAEGGKASSRYIPPAISLKRKKRICKSITATIAALIKKVAKYSEEDLDDFILPHPLLGKVTLREMLYFTAYHVDHHKTNIKELLSYKPA